MEGVTLTFSSCINLDCMKPKIEMFYSSLFCINYGSSNETGTVYCQRVPVVNIISMVYSALSLRCCNIVFMSFMPREAF